MLTVTDTKPADRKTILERTIDQDKEAVINRWINTFSDVNPVDPEFTKNNSALKIIMTSMAAIAKGDFEINVSGQPGAYAAPSKALSITDYFSHASRVIIDIKALSTVNKILFLSFFSREQLTSRGSSHYTETTPNGVIEKKDVLRRAEGVLKTWANQLFGFNPTNSQGIDIMMGGTGQWHSNHGNSKMGTNGHVCIYFDQPDPLMINSVMLGVEQFSPFDSEEISQGLIDAANLLFGTSKSSSSANGNSFGSYTAAGSLHFNNLIYQVKLLEQKQSLTPAKYNGMRVILNDSNFEEVKNWKDTFEQHINNKSFEDIKTYLNQVPKTSNTFAVTEAVEETYLTWFNTISNQNLNDFFQQMSAIYDESLTNIPSLFSNKLNDFLAWQKDGSLPQEFRTLIGFYKGEINSTNEHITRLSIAFNRAITHLKNKTTEELRDKKENPSHVFKDFEVLIQAYSDPNLNLNKDEAYKNLFHQQEKLNHIYSQIHDGLKSESDADKNFPFSCLTQLNQMQQELNELINANQNHLIICLSKKLQAQKLSISTSALSTGSLFRVESSSGKTSPEASTPHDIVAPKPVAAHFLPGATMW